VLGVLVLMATATALAADVFYAEVSKAGRIYVFATAEGYREFQRSGQVKDPLTLPGRAPGGETVVAESETAAGLFLLRHERPAPTPPTPKAPDTAAAAPAYPRVKLGGQAFLSYQNGRASGISYSRFVVKRAYLNAEAALTPFLAARVTPDVSQDPVSGQYTYRLKYAYALLSTARLGFITRPWAEFGMAHTPWIDFEEKIDTYRAQDTLFFERVGLGYSADLGVVGGGLFGGEMPEAYQKEVSSGYPGRYGSFAIGVYNGGGYAAAEKNTNKPVEGRLTVRPLPETAPGLQLSYFGVVGKGNTTLAPDVTLNAGSLTFESRLANVVATYVRGKGNLAGTLVDADGASLPYTAWSGFAEGKLSRRWSVFARCDRFTADTGTPDASRATRALAGVAYHIGRGNDVLLDYDELSYSAADRPDDTRLQLTLQLKF